MVKRRQLICVDGEDLRIAKGIASFKGMTLSEYFKRVMDEEGQKFHQEMKSDMPIYRRVRR